MGQPFTCAICGVTQTRRSHFLWLVRLVGFLDGQVWVGGDAVCVRCAPRWATASGRILYALIAVCLLLVAWKFGLFRGNAA
jgi:hypothetical protein